MHDVARRAQVSLKTVSRVVNREPGVSPALTHRVEEAVAALGYRPDDRARRLRSSARQTGTIGFVLIDVANPFFSSLLRGIEDVARAKGYLVLSGSTDGATEREEQLIDAFLERRVDGLIVVPSGQAVETLLREIDRGSPLVLVDIELDTDAPIDLVRSDHYGGARLATQHLIDRGHRHIAFLGDDRSVFSAEQRLRGYEDTMRSAGLDPSLEQKITGTHTADEWRTITHAIFRQPHPPTALFTAQNFASMGAVAALHDLEIQHEIAVVGFDDIDLADAVDPGLTVVPQRPRELGQRAAELIFSRIEGSDSDVVREIVPHAIVARGSGEIAPAAR
jgi:LacI family transcriptional regulator